jgi:phosphoribosylformylglycinamidine (FGAM) synthase-like amidotransferase family enzyme
VSNENCNLVVKGVTPLEVPLASGNGKFVSDSSSYTTFKHLESINLTYNDKTGGGDEHNGSYSFLNNLRG